jgi:hypothetical protein
MFTNIKKTQKDKPLLSIYRFRLEKRNVEKETWRETWKKRNVRNVDTHLRRNVDTH